MEPSHRPSKCLCNLAAYSSATFTGCAACFDPIDLATFEAVLADQHWQCTVSANTDQLDRAQPLGRQLWTKSGNLTSLATPLDPPESGN
jgi:hypothetical protein